MLNDKMKTMIRLKDMNYDIAYLVNYIKKYMTINQGDILLTGSDDQRIYLNPNDRIEARLKCGGETMAEVAAHMVPRPEGKIIKSRNE